MISIHSHSVCPYKPIRVADLPAIKYSTVSWLYTLRHKPCQFALKRFSLLDEPTPWLEDSIMTLKFVEHAHEVNLPDAQIDIVGGDQINYYNFKSHIRKEDPILAILKPAKRSEYYHPRCMERTRESVFKDIYHWLDGMYSLRVPSLLESAANILISARQPFDAKHHVDQW
jgi:hypothetical protein